jgi:outer membrane lipoprotein-sorting protein
MFPRFPRTALVAVALLAGLLLTFPATVRAQEPPQPPIPRPANVPVNVAKALADMLAAHQALTSYAATIDLNLKNPESTLTAHADVILAKPGGARATAKTTFKGGSQKQESTRTIISDGKEMIGLDAADLTTYRKVPAPPPGKNMTVALQNSGSTYLPWLGMLFENPVVKDLLIPPDATEVTLKTGQKLGGEEVSVISAIIPTDTGKMTLQLFIGKKDNLLRRILLNTTNGDATSTVMETYSNIKVNQTVPAETFTFTPGPNQKLYMPNPSGPAPAEKP